MEQASSSSARRSDLDELSAASSLLRPGQETLLARRRGRWPLVSAVAAASVLYAAARYSRGGGGAWSASGVAEEALSRNEPGGSEAFGNHAIDAVGGGGAGGGVFGAVPASLFSRSSTASAQEDELSLTVMNEYAQLDALPAGTGYPWAETTPLVEPWKITYLLVDGADAFSTYDWTITQTSNVVASSGDGAPQHTSGFGVSFVFENLGEYLVELTETPPAQYHLGAGRAIARTLVCRYVRREVRRLSDKDRELYLDAVQQLAALGAAEGRAKYGARFFNLDHFASLHLALSATRGPDQLHDGVGFLTGMIALSGGFERALQSVNPSLSLPYWDYTYDASALANSSSASSSSVTATTQTAAFRATTSALAEGGDAGVPTSAELAARFFDSDLWESDFFGDHVNANHTVTAGRFAYQTVGAANATSPVISPYGYLRAPWNVNRSPYVRRDAALCGASSFDYGSFPTCATHSSLVLDPTYASAGSWVMQAQYAPYRPVGVALGGVGGCADALAPLADSLGAASAKKVNVMAHFATKVLWREGTVDAPSFCSKDTPQAECTMVCPSATKVLSGLLDLEIESLESSDGSLSLASLGGRRLAALRRGLARRRALRAQRQEHSPWDPADDDDASGGIAITGFLPQPDGSASDAVDSTDDADDAGAKGAGVAAVGAMPWDPSTAATASNGDSNTTSPPATGDDDAGAVIATAAQNGGATDDHAAGAVSGDDTDDVPNGGNTFCETSVDCDPGYQCEEGTCVVAVRGPTPKPSMPPATPTPTTPSPTTSTASSSSTSSSTSSSAPPQHQSQNGVDGDKSPAAARVAAHGTPDDDGDDDAAGGTETVSGDDTDDVPNGGNTFCETSVDCDPGYQCEEGTCVVAVRGPTPRPSMPPTTPTPTAGSDDDAGSLIATAAQNGGTTDDHAAGAVSGDDTDDVPNGGNTFCETSVDCDPGYQCEEGTCVVAVRGPTPKPSMPPATPSPTSPSMATTGGIATTGSTEHGGKPTASSKYDDDAAAAADSGEAAEGSAVAASSGGDDDAGDDDDELDTLEQMLAAISAVCDASLVPGEAVDASAPYDVAWWSMFPTVERLWVRRKLSRGFSDESWGASSTSSAALSCTSAASGSSCVGHNADDVISLPFFARGADGYFRARHYTNAELYELADPAAVSGNYSLPYVYEHFEWPHCATDGYSF